MIDFIFWIVAVCGVTVCKADPTATPPVMLVCVLEKSQLERMQSINLQDGTGKILMRVIPVFCPSA